MKKLILNHKRNLTRGIMPIVIMALLCVSFSSCDKDKDKDDNDKQDGYLITATNVEGAASSIVSVKALLDDGMTIATAAYSNDGFTIGLPNPDSKHIDDFYDQVGACFLDGFYAYNKKDDMLGKFIYAKMSSNGTMTMGLYIYIDDDVELH